MTFKPTYANARTANLVISSNDPTTPVLIIPLTGNGGLIPLTITASSPTVAWGTGVPLITPIVTGLVAPDTINSLTGLNCTTTYTVISNAGTYPTMCAGAVNSAYSFAYAQGKLTVNPATAVMLTPTPGSVLPTSPVTFTWNTGGSVTYYNLYVGTTGVGSRNLLLTNQIGALSATVTVPATGGTVFVRLYTIIKGVWQYVDYTYKAAPAPPPPTPVTAALVTPTTGTILTSTQQFTWNTGVGVTYYKLYVGTTGVGSRNLLLTNQTVALSATATGIPTNGSTIYVRLYSMINGVWQYTDYTFK